MNDIGQLWDRFEHWLGSNHKEFLSELGPPTAASDIAGVERELKLRLPDEVKAFYARHNGQRDIYSYPFDRHCFLALANIKSTISGKSLGADVTPSSISAMKSLAGFFPSLAGNAAYLEAETKNVWPRHLLPLFADPTFNKLIGYNVDDGTVVAVACSMRKNKVTSLAPSLTAWFADYVEALELGLGLYRGSDRSIRIDRAATPKQPVRPVAEAEHKEAEKGGIDTQRVNAFWDRIEAYLEMRHPVALAALRPGADERDLQEVADELGFPLPEALRAFWLRHDGVVDAGRNIPTGTNLFGDYVEMLGCIAALDEWRQQLSLHEGGELVGMETPTWLPPIIRQTSWHRGWLPIGIDGGGDCYFVDLDPAPSGNIGQVLELQHASDEMPILGKTFVEFFESYTERLCAGEISLDEEED